MKAIQLFISLSDDLGIQSITFSYNDTELPSDWKTLNAVANAILKAIKANKDRIIVDELLDDLNIKRLT